MRILGNAPIKRNSYKTLTTSRKGDDNMGENWIKNKETVSEKDVSAATKADKIERKKIRAGWRWVKIIPSLKILVPFEKGKPTAEGQAMIDIMKAKFYVK